MVMKPAVVRAYCKLLATLASHLLTSSDTNRGFSMEYVLVARRVFIETAIEK